MFKLTLSFCLLGVSLCLTLPPPISLCLSMSLLSLCLSVSLSVCISRSLIDASGHTRDRELQAQQQPTNSMRMKTTRHCRSHPPAHLRSPGRRAVHIHPRTTPVWPCLVRAKEPCEFCERTLCRDLAGLTTALSVLRSG